MPNQIDLDRIAAIEQQHQAKSPPAPFDRLAGLREQAAALRDKLPGTFLYIQEDGVILKSDTPPTVADFLAETEGLLTIIRIKAGEVVQLTHDGVVELPPAAIHDDPNVGLYHARVRVPSSNRSDVPGSSAAPQAAN